MGDINSTLGWSCDESYYINKSGKIGIYGWNGSFYDILKINEGPAIISNIIANISGLMHNIVCVASTDVNFVTLNCTGGSIAGYITTGESYVINGITWYYNMVGTLFSENDGYEKADAPEIDLSSASSKSDVFIGLLEAANVNYGASIVSIPIRWNNLETAFDISVL